MRLRKKTWFLCSSYNLKKNLIANHLNCIDRKLDSQLGQYEVIDVIEIGLSDFNKMSLTVMKVFYNKQKPKIIQYRKYKDFSNETFMHELENASSRFSHISFGRLKST